MQIRRRALLAMGVALAAAGAPAGAQPQPDVPSSDAPSSDASTPVTFCAALNAALDAAAANTIATLALTPPMRDRPAGDRVGDAVAPLAPPPFTACARTVAGFSSCAVEASPFGAGWTLALQPGAVSSAPLGSRDVPPAPADARAFAAMVEACPAAAVASYEPPWPAGPRVRERVGFTARDGRARIIITASGRSEAEVLTLLVEAHSRDAEGPQEPPPAPDAGVLAPDHTPLRTP